MATILIVDDEHFIHDLYRNILDTSGKHVVIADAYDGVEAIEVYKGSDPKPDIVIMDHRMPEMDGLEGTKALLELDPNVKVIFASADSSIKRTAIENGASGFLSKPFRFRELIAQLDSVLGDE